MSDSAGEPRSAPYLRAVRLSALAVVAIGSVVLLGGWTLDIRELRTVIPGAS